MASELATLTEWPKTSDAATVDLMLRIIGCETQRVWLEKREVMDAGDKPDPNAPLYMLRTQMVISSVGFMACLRRLREVDAEAAARFAAEYWEMCDAGDSFGETLWEFTEAAGLNPELVKLPERIDEASGDGISEDCITE